MNIHEYQSKAILRSYGVNVPAGKPAFSVEEAVENARELGTDTVVVKAQIHAGGRGKAGGVKVVHSLEAVEKAAEELLGKVLITHQTGPAGKRVNRLLIEAGAAIKKEYYLSFVIDRQTARIVMMGSEEGGMEIEKVAAEMPDKILKEYIDPAVGLLPFQANRMAYGMHFPARFRAQGHEAHDEPLPGFRWQGLQPCRDQSARRHGRRGGHGARRQAQLR